MITRIPTPIVAPMNLRRRAIMESDMNTADDWTLYANGTGATGIFTGTALNTDGNRVGVLDCQTGTTAAGWSGAANAVRDSVVFGSRVHRYVWIGKIPVLGTAAQSFNAIVGFHDRANALLPTDGVYFNYHYATNGGRWQSIVYAAGVTTGAIDTGITVDTGWHSMEITVDIDDVARFYIDSVFVDSQSVGLGATAADARITKLIGTTSSSMYIDAMSLEIDVVR
jgi:hypothetical protein